MYFNSGFQLYHIDNPSSKVSTAVIRLYSVWCFSSPSGPFAFPHKEGISLEVATTGQFLTIPS